MGSNDITGPTGPAYIPPHWEYRLVSVQPGVQDDLESLKNALSELWEPYAVTWNGAIFDHHLRRFTKKGI